MTVRDYSTTPGNNNAAPPHGFPEGAAASTVNDCARQMMAEVRETFEEIPYFDFGDDPTRVDNDTFTVATDLTARYPVGTRVKLVGATTGYGRITVSSFGAGVTTIDVVMDSGNVPTSLTRVAVMPVATFGTINFNTLGSTALAITPTWSATHTFSKTGGGSASGVYMSAAFPFATWNATGDSANNKRWQMGVSSEQFLFQTLNDADASAATILTVDRTGTTVDRVAFPAEANQGFSVGTIGTAINNSRAGFRTTNTGAAAAQFQSASNLLPVIYVHNEDTSGNNVFVEFRTEAGVGSTRGNIDYNRAGTAVRYNTTCDRDLKEAIESAPSALAALRQIPVRKYRWRESKHSVEHGFIAQEVYEYFPDAVSPGADGRPWGMDYSKLVPILFKAVQELAAEVAALRPAVVSGK